MKINRATKMMTFANEKTSFWGNSKLFEESNAEFLKQKSEKEIELQPF